MIENLQSDNTIEKAILVGLDTGDKDLERLMAELSKLTEVLGIEPVSVLTQSLEHPVAATYIGTGKVREVAQEAAFYDAKYVIFEDSLSPSQLNNLQNEIDAVVMDRTNLILEIFVKRAKTREAKLQVESAMLSYMLPRLVGMRKQIDRQGGGSGSLSNKGSGEKQLELDRRRIVSRIAELRAELELIEHDRGIQRKRREKSSLPLVALVGYTNAGKSTVLNALLDYASDEVSEDKKVLSKDMLFATLDTTVRRIETDNHRDFLLSDTVGFIDNLPTTLVKAFRSTLDEIKYADLLLEVVDSSDPDYKEQMDVTARTLADIGAKDIPVIHVMNKCDRRENISYPRINDNHIYISAKDDESIACLVKLITDTVYEDNKTVQFVIPYAKGNVVSDINENARVLKQDYEEDGVHMTADCTKEIIGRYVEYII